MNYFYRDALGNFLRFGHATLVGDVIYTTRSSAARDNNVSLSIIKQRIKSNKPLNGKKVVDLGPNRYMFKKYSGKLRLSDSEISQRLLEKCREKCKKNIEETKNWRVVL